MSCIKIKYWWYVLVIALGIAILAVWVTCRQVSLPMVTPSLAIQPSLTPTKLPPFLLHVYPKPGENVIRWPRPENYIWATLDLGEIFDPGEPPKLEEMRERIEFLLDDAAMDVKIDQDYGRGKKVEISGGGLVFSLGEHKFTIRVHKPSGEILEYSWTFTVTPDPTRIPGLPGALMFVYPLPDSTITLQAYKEGESGPFFSTSSGRATECVCVGVDPGEVVQPGEQLGVEDVGRRYDFVALDGVPPAGNAQIGTIYDLAKLMFMDEDGKIVTSFPGPKHYKCWPIELAPGEHKVTVKVQKAPEEIIEYTWRFTITSD